MKTAIENKVNFWYLLLLVLLYKFSLDYIYYFIITDYYFYLGFERYFDSLSYIFSYIIIFLSIFPLKKLFENFHNPSAIIMIVFYLIYFYPNLTFNTLSNLSGDFFTLSLLYWFILTILYFKINIDFGKNFNPKYRILKFYTLLFTVVGLALAFTIYYNGLQIKFDLKNIYDIRLGVRELDMPGILGYIKPLASKFVIIGLMYFLIRKNLIMAGVMTLLVLMFFAFGAHKTDFFLLILSFIVYFFYKLKFRLLILYGLISINFFVLILYINNYSFLIDVVSAIHVRSILTPNLLSYYYFDYFSRHELLFFREHIYHWLGIESKNIVNSPYLIAEYYFNNDRMSANTGLIGSDFAQFGWAAILLLPFIRVIFLKVLDNASIGLDNRIMVIVSFIFALTYINGALLTTLLTGGFILVCLLLFLIPRNFKKS